jgi:cyclopropane fatty-acyl-phospholipid synthase-like methyltransferase
MEDLDALSAQRWNAEYLAGKYKNEGPVPFVGDIKALIEAAGLSSGRGLYIGCGNGRNYLPLVKSGLNLEGIDISGEAIDQLKAKVDQPDKLRTTDLTSYESDRPLDYIIALQVFQHGRYKVCAQNFAKAKSLLRPGGLFFLRVNSIATEIEHSHEVVERTQKGGNTIQYLQGPKDGLEIHFFSDSEIIDLMSNGFEVAMDLRERFMQRPHNLKGSWAQWEGAWRKK